MGRRFVATELGNPTKEATSYSQKRKKQRKRQRGGHELTLQPGRKSVIFHLSLILSTVRPFYSFLPNSLFLATRLLSGE